MGPTGFPSWRAPTPARIDLLRRLAAAAAAGIGAAVVCAVLAAVVELYLTGHGLGSIGAPLIEMPAAGVHLSIGDTVLLITAAGAAVATFLLTGRAE